MIKYNIILLYSTEFCVLCSLGISLPDGYGMHWVDGTKNIHNLDETGKYQLLFTATYFSECYRLLYCHEVNSIIYRHTYNTTL